MPINRSQAGALVRAAQSANNALARARKNAREDADQMRDAAAALAGGALVGALRGGLKRDVVHEKLPVPIDLALGAGGMAFALLSKGDKRTRDMVRGAAAGALAVFASRKAEEIAREKFSSSTEGEIIGALPHYHYAGMRN